MQVSQALDPIEALRQQFGDAILHVSDFRDDLTVVVDRDMLPEVADYLRVTQGLIYNFLSDITPVDYYPLDYGARYTYRPERFALSYHLYSLLYNRRIRIKVFVPEEEPVVPTLIDIWPAANWLEREAYDLMGIDFDGHPDKRRLLMPDDWNGNPLRRDVPVGKETVQFSFNVEEILENKLKADSDES